MNGIPTTAIVVILGVITGGWFYGVEFQPSDSPGEKSVATESPIRQPSDCCAQPYPEKDEDCCAPPPELEKDDYPKEEPQEYNPLGDDFPAIANQNQ